MFTISWRLSACTCIVLKADNSLTKLIEHPYLRSWWATTTKSGDLIILLGPQTHTITFNGDCANSSSAFYLITRRLCDFVHYKHFLYYICSSFYRSTVLILLFPISVDILSHKLKVFRDIIILSSYHHHHLLCCMMILTKRGILVFCQGDSFNYYSPRFVFLLPITTNNYQ